MIQGALLVLLHQQRALDLERALDLGRAAIQGW
jgi:hypothetical protein